MPTVLKTLIVHLLIYIPFTMHAQFLFVSDAGNFDEPPWQILRFDSNGGNPELFIRDSLAWPQDLIVIEDRNELWVSNLSSGQIVAYDLEQGTFLRREISDLEGPTRMAFGPDHRLYILQWSGSGRIMTYDMIDRTLQPFTITGIDQSIGMAWDAAENLYVSSYGDRSIYRIAQGGDSPEVWIDSTHLQGPTNIWFNENGDLLVADFKGGTIQRFDRSGAHLGVFCDGLGKSEGIVQLPDGSLLIGDGKTHSIKQISPDGTILKDFVSAESGGLKTPNALLLYFPKK